MLEMAASNETVNTTAHYLIEGLVELGIDYLFCNMGTDHAPIIEELANWDHQGRKRPEVVLCSHENVAAHMAAGYAQLTGRGQGLLAHVDSGTANISMALHNLFRSRVPVLVMAGIAPSTSRGELVGTRDAYVHFMQEPYDQASLVRPYLKWEYTLISGVTAKETLRRAHTIMESEPKGPVYLMLPRETLAQNWADSEIMSFPEESYGAMERAGADPRLVDRLARRILDSENPLIITSYCGRDPQSADALDALATYAGIGIIEHHNGVNVSHASPCFIGDKPQDLENVDLGLLVDVDVPWIPVQSKLNPQTFWAQVDVDVLKAGSPMSTFPSNLRIQGHSGLVLTQLLERLRELATPVFSNAARQRLDRLRELSSARREKAASLAADKGKVGEINPHYLTAEIGRMIQPEDIVINEASTSAPVANMQIPRPLPCTLFSTSGGGLGASGGMALGAKLARPEQLVVQLVGDGGFYFNNQLAVFAAAKQYGLPILTVIFDNAGWAAVKNSTLRVYPDGRARASDRFQAELAPEMDFAKVAEAAGGYGEKVVDPEQVTAALERCLAAVRAGRSALLHACVTRF